MTVSTDVRPLVSVGIPTYDRPHTLERAVRSVLSQEYEAVEVVVSDNASRADTSAVLESLAAADSRVRWERQAENVGSIRNFQRAFELTVGEYFLWLSDDDWLDPTYIRRCVEALRGDRSLIGACGRAHYTGQGGQVFEERPLQMLDKRAGARVLRYFTQVTTNGIFYSVVARERLDGIKYPECIGGDWLLVSALACRGRLRTLDGVYLMCSADGMSSDCAALAAGEFGLSGLSVRFPHLAIGWNIARHIAWSDAAFAPLGAWRRVPIGLAAGIIVALRFTGRELARRGLRRIGLGRARDHLLAVARRCA